MRITFRKPNIILLSVSIFILFILKVTKITDISWIWVFSPLWIEVVSCIFLLFVVFMIGFLLLVTEDIVRYKTINLSFMDRQFGSSINKKNKNKKIIEEY